MSIFAPLQYKSARTTSSIRHHSSVLRPSRWVELPEDAPGSATGASSDQQHAAGFSLGHIPIHSPVQAPYNIFEKHRENHTGLPDKLKAGIERLSGMSMDEVNIHYNSSKPAEVKALAYTKGTDIHVGPGQEQHLAHEAWHVVQQKQGRVRPIMRVKGVAINDDEALEKEAELIGKRVKTERVHTDAKADTLSHSVESEAFTTGTNNFFRSGMFNTSTSQGMHLLAHEATHEVQQASDGLNSQVIQRLKGPLPKKAKGLSKKEIRELIKESETTKFDMRGHTTSKHGSKVTDEKLMERLYPEEGKRVNLATSFSSDELLIRTIEKAVADNIGTINAWLESKTADHLVLEVDMSKELKEGESLGEGLQRVGGIGPRANKVANLTNATVIFRKVLPDTITKSMDLAKATEWHLLTAFPSE